MKSEGDNEMSYQPGFPPPPPPKKNGGKIALIGCGGVLALALFGGCVAAVSSVDDSDSSDSTASSAPASTVKPQPSAADPTTVDPTPAPKASEAPKKETVVFKVWGTAPSGALGPLSITYGSDSDTREGSFKNGEFTATLPLDGDAMYYMVTAQLQGSGDINCSVTIDGETKKAHASGGYNICHAQANGGLLGGWD
jgi:hypothetical protein